MVAPHFSENLYPKFKEIDAPILRSMNSYEVARSFQNPPAKTVAPKEVPKYKRDIMSSEDLMASEDSESNLF